MLYWQQTIMAKNKGAHIDVYVANLRLCCSNMQKADFLVPPINHFTCKPQIYITCWAFKSVNSSLTQISIH